MKFLIALAALPGLFLAYKIYKLDKIESEPMNLIVLLFFLGVLSTLPASILESIGGSILKGFVREDTNIYNLIYFFVGVALVEELCKYIMLRIGSWKKADFDYVFDGIVYAVVTSCGFAVFENILYGFSYGLGVLLLRAITSIPGHIIFGIFMGHFYGLAKQAEARGESSSKAMYLVLALLVPIILHGTYDYAASSESLILTLFFFAFIVVLDIVAYNKVKRYSLEDQHV